MAIIHWLEEARHLAQKQLKKLDDELIDVLALKPIAEVDIKKYLSITVEERMKQTEKLTHEKINLTFDISGLTNMIWRENRQRILTEKKPID